MWSTTHTLADWLSHKNSDKKSWGSPWQAQKNLLRLWLCNQECNSLVWKKSMSHPSGNSWSCGVKRMNRLRLETDTYASGCSLQVPAQASWKRACAWVGILHFARCHVQSDCPETHEPSELEGKLDCKFHPMQNRCLRPIASEYHEGYFVILQHVIAS